MDLDWIRTKKALLANDGVSAAYFMSKNDLAKLDAKMKLILILQRI